MTIPIACSLDADGQQARAAEWKELLGAAAQRHERIGGTRLRFDDSELAADIARLAVAELRCCAFFEFALHLDTNGVTLDITAPSGAEPLVEWLFGTGRP